MSSCFLVHLKDDSIEGIYDTLKTCAQISKSAGGACSGAIETSSSPIHFALQRRPRSACCLAAARSSARAAIRSTHYQVHTVDSTGIDYRLWEIKIVRSFGNPLD